jgi:hypothetical protein
MKEQVKVSPADVEARVDAIFAAAIDRGLDAVAKQELTELRALVGELVEVVNGNAQTLVNLRDRVIELEAAVRQPELVLAEPLDGVVFEGSAREPIANTRQRHMDPTLRIVKGNQ